MARGLGLSIGRMVALTLGVAIVSVTPALGEVSFKGKTVNIIISSNAGGGTDGFARTVGTFLPKYLPGSPQILYRNIGGGGGLKAQNYFYTRAEPDGLTTIGSSQDQLSSSKLLNEATKYKPQDYEFVGGFSGASNPFIIRSKDRSRLTDPQAAPLIYGDPDGDRPGVQASVWAKEYLGWNIRFVLGYSSTGALFTAFRGGEIDVQLNYMATNYLLEQKDKDVDGLEVIAILGKHKGDGTDWSVRHPAFADVPFFDDLIRPKLDPAALKAYELWLNGYLVDKWMALPPKTPRDIADAYGKAFEQMVNDPKFVDSIMRTFGFSETPSWMFADQLKDVATKQAATTRADLDFFIALRKKHGVPVSEH